MHNYLYGNPQGHIANDLKNKENMYQHVKKYMNQKMHIQTFSGDSFNVYVDHVDAENVYLTLASQRMETSSRQWGFGYPDYGYGGYGPGYGFGGYGPGYGYGGFGGIGSLILPLTAIAGISAAGF